MTTAQKKATWERSGKKKFYDTTKNTAAAAAVLEVDERREQLAKIIAKSNTADE